MITTPPSPCPPSSRWLEWLSGAVASPDLEALEDHLGRCACCLEAVSSLGGPDEADPTPGPWRGAGFGRGSFAMPAAVARRSGDELAASPPGPPRPDPGPPAIPGLRDLKPIGRGGSGTVYSAIQGDLGRRVAVKVLSTGLVPDDRARARVLREARVLARLRHPNVVRIHDSGEVGGSPYLVMELVEGGTLQDRLDRGVLPFREAAATVRQLAMAAGEAHSLGIVHRDLKPSNVLMAPPSEPGGPDVPKLADFGLARDGGQDERLTLTGQVLGTPAYMSPEQAGLGRDAGEVGPASDVHGLGALLQACLTGRPPYRGDSIWEVLSRVAQGQPDPVRAGRPDVPRDLETIVDKCLGRDPARRYRSAGELAEDLGRYLEGRPVSARPVSAATRAAKWARRRPALAAAALLVALLVVGGVAGGSYHVVQLRRAFDRTDKALKVANRARERSRRALETLTDDAIKTMIDRGSVLNDKDLAFLRKVRGFYEEPDRDGEAEEIESLRFRAGGLVRLAGLFDRIGRTGDCEAAYRAGIASHSEILRARPDDPSAAVDRAEAQHNLCDLLTSTKNRRYDEARALADAMVEGLRPLVGASDDRRVTFLSCLMGRANVLWASGRREEAEGAYADAAEFARALKPAMGHHPDFWRAEFRVLANRGMNLRWLERLAPAEAMYSAALALAEGHAAERPTDIYWLDRALHVLDKLVELRIAADQAAPAGRAQARRRELVRLRASRFPGDPEQANHVVDLAISSNLLRNKGWAERDEVEAELREVIAIGVRKASEGSANYGIYTQLMHAMSCLAKLLTEAGRLAEAVEVFDREVALGEPWLKLGKQEEVALEYSRHALDDVANLLSRLGRFDEAVRRSERALATYEEGPIRRARPSLKLARHLRAAGRLADARAAAESACLEPKIAEIARNLIEEIDAEVEETAPGP